MFYTKFPLNRCTFSFTVCLVLLINISILAQDYKVDSLQSILDTTTISTLRADILLELSFAYRNSKPRFTIQYADTALMLSNEIKYPKGQAQSLRNIGLGHMKLGNYDSAVFYCNKAIQIAEQYGVQDSKADAFNTLGIIYYYQAKYDEALQAFEEIADVYKKMDKKADLAGSYTNIGTILENKGDLNRALEYYNKALLLFEELNHLDGIATVTNNMAGILKNEGDTEKALAYFLRTAQIDSITHNLAGFANTLGNIADVKLLQEDTAGSIEDYRRAIQLYAEAEANCNIGRALSQLGDIFLKQDRLDSAYVYISRAVEITRTCNNLEDFMGASIDFGKYYGKTGDFTKAISYFNQSYDIASKEGAEPMLSQAAEQLYLVYKKLGHTKKALHYLEIHFETENKLYNVENTRKIAQLEAAYDLEKEKQAFANEKELNRLKFEKEITKQKAQQTDILIALLCFFIILIVLSWLYIQTKRFNKKLDGSNKEILAQKNELKERNELVESQRAQLLNANEELKELNEEKNTLIGIVAHDLKSPINQIKGLIMISKLNGVDQIPEELQENLAMMEISSQRSIDMIDRILDINAIESKKVTLEIASVNPTQLLKELDATFRLQAATKRISLKLSIENSQTQVETDRVLLIEILENLISNAIKFSPTGSEVVLGFRTLAEKPQFFVADQGPGISESDQQKMFYKYQRLTANPTAGETSSGLGLAIVKRLTEVLGGKITCESNSGKGSIFILELRN